MPRPPSNVRRLRARGALLAAASLAFVACGLFAPPGEYTAGGPDADVDLPDVVQRDAPVASDAEPLPDVVVEAGSAGTLVVFAGGDASTEPDTWVAETHVGILDGDGRVVGWTTATAPSRPGYFEGLGLLPEAVYMISAGVTTGEGRGPSIQSIGWAAGPSGAFRASTVFPPGGLVDHTYAFYGGYVAFVGGTRTTPGVDGGASTTSYVNEVHRSRIDTAEGDLDGTTDSTRRLVVGRSRSSVLYALGGLYVVGGRIEGGVSGAVDMATADGDSGALGAFTAQPELRVGGDVHGVFGAGLAYADGYLFVAGGRVDAANTPTAVVLSSKIDPTTGALGAFQELTSLPRATRSFGFAAHAGRLYVIGGVLASNERTAEVLVADIASNGTLGTWKTDSAPLPASRSHLVALGF